MLRLSENKRVLTTTCLDCKHLFEDFEDYYSECEGENFKEGTNAYSEKYGKVKVEFTRTISQVFLHDSKRTLNP